MAISGSVTVSAFQDNYVVNASGSGFGIFSSFTAYASQAIDLNPELGVVGGNSYYATGSESYSLDTSFGQLVFTGTDTIDANSVDSYTFVGSETLSFVSGNDTLDFATGSLSSTGANASVGLATDAVSSADQFFNSIITLGNVTTAPDDLSAAYASSFGVVAAAVATVTGGAAGGATPVTYTLNDSSGLITFIPLSPPPP